LYTSFGIEIDQWFIVAKTRINSMINPTPNEEITSLRTRRSLQADITSPARIRLIAARTATNRADVRPLFKSANMGTNARAWVIIRPLFELQFEPHHGQAVEFAMWWAARDQRS
jgi:hypothetical protein